MRGNCEWGQTWSGWIFDPGHLRLDCTHTRRFVLRRLYLSIHVRLRTNMHLLARVRASNDRAVADEIRPKRKPVKKQFLPTQAFCSTYRRPRMHDGRDQMSWGCALFLPSFAVGGGEGFVRGALRARPNVFLVTDRNFVHFCNAHFNLVWLGLKFFVVLNSSIRKHKICIDRR